MCDTGDDYFEQRATELAKEADQLEVQYNDLRTILGEVRRMLDEEEDPVGILGYIDESMLRVRG